MKARRQRTKVSSESADDAAGQSNLKRQKGRPAIDSRALKGKNPFKHRRSSSIVAKGAKSY